MYRRHTHALACLYALVLAACNEKPSEPVAAAPSLDRETDHRSGDFLGRYGVGHTTIEVVHTGSLGERRPVNVHVWYPARRAGAQATSQTVYRSRLFGLPLVPGTHDPLAYEIRSEVAREGVAIARGGSRFPLLIWSHGATNDAIDYAFQAEALASDGFVVAGPEHPGDSQDDVLVDFINQLVGAPVLECLDALPPPCGADALGRSIQNRVRDVSALIDDLERINATQFASRIDVSRVGLIGHSRGTLTALAAIAGHSVLGVTADQRIDAIITMSAGNLTFPADQMAAVSRPVLMLTGGSDELRGPAAVRPLFDQLSNTSRMWVVIREGEHRGFASALCTMMQAAGGVRMANLRAVLDEQTIRRLVGGPTGAGILGREGSTLDYCGFDAFIDPVDIRPLVTAFSGVEVTPGSVPRTLDAAQVARLSVRLAAAFFGAAFDERRCGGFRLPRMLNPEHLLRHEPNVASAEAIIPGHSHRGDDDDDDEGCDDGE